MEELKTTIEETVSDMEKVATPIISETEDVESTELEEVQSAAPAEVEISSFSTVKIPREEYKELAKKEALLDLLIDAKKNHSTTYAADYILNVLVGKEQE